MGLGKDQEIAYPFFTLMGKTNSTWGKIILLIANYSTVGMVRQTKVKAPFPHAPTFPQLIFAPSQSWILYLLPLSWPGCSQGYFSHFFSLIPHCHAAFIPFLNTLSLRHHQLTDGLGCGLGRGGWNRMGAAPASPHSDHPTAPLPAPGHRPGTRSRWSWQLHQQWQASKGVLVTPECWQPTVQLMVTRHLKPREKWDARHSRQGRPHQSLGTWITAGLATKLFSVFKGHRDSNNKSKL